MSILIFSPVPNFGQQSIFHYCDFFAIFAQTNCTNEIDNPNNTLAKDLWNVLENCSNEICPNEISIKQGSPVFYIGI